MTLRLFRMKSAGVVQWAYGPDVGLPHLHESGPFADRLACERRNDGARHRDEQAVIVHDRLPRFGETTKLGCQVDRCAYTTSVEEQDDGGRVELDAFAILV